MYADELSAMFLHYSRTGFPTMPDQPQSRSTRTDEWFPRLTSTEQARIRHAIEQGGRNGSSVGPWTELA